MESVKAIEFSNIISSIVHLFRRDDYFLNLTNYAGEKIRANVIMAEIIEREIHFDVDEDWYADDVMLPALENFFKEFALHFSTGDAAMDSERTDRHFKINRDCKTRKFKRDFAYHIYRALRNLKRSSLYPNPDDKNTFFKIITDYVYSLYSIEK